MNTSTRSFSVSPLLAMLWEQWRLTRIEAAQRFGISVVLASAALSLLSNGETAAYAALIFMNWMPWLSIFKLNGGRLMDGYKPGFPLQLLYTRPIPTTAMVCVAMLYDAITGTALYLVSAAVVGIAFGVSLPLFAVVMWLVTFHLVAMCVQWSTQNRVVQWVGSFALCLPLMYMLRSHRETPLHVEFSSAEHLLMAFAGVVAIALTVSGVSRQRGGGAVAVVPRTATAGGYPEWLVGLFRIPCPTDSATKAMVWFELRSGGLPVLAIGLCVALVIPLLFAIGIPVVQFRPFAVAVGFMTVPAVLLFLGGNAFGIRHRQGRTYLRAFEATRPCPTAQWAGLKLLVRTTCLLAAVLAIGVSWWASSSMVSAWVPWLIGGKESTPSVLKLRETIANRLFEAPTGYEYLLLPLLLMVGVALMIATRATFTALHGRYRRIVNGVVFGVLLFALAFVLAFPLVNIGLLSKDLVETSLRAIGWAAAAALLLAIFYLLRSGFAERALTSRYVVGAFAIAVAFGATWLAAMRIEGAPIIGMSATNYVAVSSLTLLPFALFILATWSLNRLRHM
jgi:hypothetical protein